MKYLNPFLDDIPRTHLFRFHANVPAYRTCGVVGFYFAVLAVVAAGLFAGRTLWVLLVLSAAAALSFFVYAHLRRLILGRECIVLLEHVWVALAAMAGTLIALRQPLLPYLDAVTPALALFLAFGRLGCTFVGCCHGVPSAVGIVYPESFVAHGFVRKFAGIRLFPVAAVEMVALLGIAASCFVALRLPVGFALAWFLISYAFVRYALEELRGDARPHWLGLSLPQWMCAIQCAAALGWLIAPGYPLMAAASLAAPVAIAFLRYLFDPTRRLLRPRRLAELREFASGELSAIPSTKESSAHMRVAASSASQPGCVHVSLSGAGSLVAVCRVAAAAFPSLDLESARLTGNGVLHFLVREGAVVHWEELYLLVVRKLQNPTAEPSAPPQPPWYFAKAVGLSHEARA